MNENDIMGWDEGLEYEEHEGGFKLLPEGEYEFTVIKLEKAFTKSGENMAKLTLCVEHEGYEYKIFDNIVLRDTLKWKLQQFFISLGLMKTGEALKKMPWGKVVGTDGRAIIFHDTYNGKTNPKVETYLEPVGKPKKEKKLPALEDDDLPFPV